ncbi:MAG: alpha/beta fold hydrolase [Alphaproteobacteria bacterium]|nr:alpha/beta fold hydrolase [Alphaproteobacteria bacterium]
MMEPVMMVPGLGSDGAVWNRTIEQLGSGYDCQVGDTLSDATLAGMAERVLAGSPERFALAGVSMGGMVAMTIMRLAPDRVTRLALFDTNARPDMPEQTARRRMASAAMLAATDLRALAAPSIASMVHPDTGQDVRDALADMTVRVGAATDARQNEAVAARDDLRPILPGIAVPTLVVVGAEDAMTPPAYAEEIANAVPSANLHIIADCGHLPPIEKPKETAALLRAWLKR